MVKVLWFWITSYDPRMDGAVALAPCDFWSWSRGTGLDPAGGLGDAEVLEFILFIEDLRRGLFCPDTVSGQATSCHCCFIVAKDLKVVLH